MKRRTPALLLVLATALPGQAQQLEGNLFTTPEQRTYLDALRQEFLENSRESGFDIEESEIPPLPAETDTNIVRRVEYTLRGILAQRDGGHIIWLNNQSLNDTQLPAGITLVITEDGKPALRFQTDTGARLLLPGQTIEITSGVVQERYQLRTPPQATDTDDTATP